MLKRRTAFFPIYFFQHRLKIITYKTSLINQIGRDKYIQYTVYAVVITDLLKINLGELKY